jgi:hypothetical protein
LRENEIDSRSIQELLGHKNIKTTETYSCVTSQAKQGLKSSLVIRKLRLLMNTKKLLRTIKLKLLRSSSSNYRPVMRTNWRCMADRCYTIYI